MSTQYWRLLEILHNQLAYIINARIRVQEDEKFPKSCDLGIISGVDDVVGDVGWYEPPNIDFLYEVNTLNTKTEFGVVAITKCVRGPT
jgi:hypothetical protein